jgi:hypothetical protein
MVFRTMNSTNGIHWYFSTVKTESLDWLADGGRLFLVTGEGPLMEARLVTRHGEDQWSATTLFETSLPRSASTATTRSRPWATELGAPMKPFLIATLFGLIGTIRGLIISFSGLGATMAGAAAQDK